MTDASASDKPWPAMTVREAYAVLTAPGMATEMEEVEIRGVKTRVWKNAPPTLRDVVTIGRAHGEKIFLVHEDERVSFEAFHRAVAAFAKVLESKGVQKGDRVAIVMRNLPEWPVAFYAGMSLGAILTPLNAWWTGPELEYGLTDSGSKVCIVDAERFDRLAEHFPNCPDLKHVIVSRMVDEVTHPLVSKLEEAIGGPNDWATLPDDPLPTVPIDTDDDATIFYTSGTTGKAEGRPGDPAKRQLQHLLGPLRRRAGLPAARRDAARARSDPAAEGQPAQRAVLPRHRLFRGAQPDPLRRRKAGHDAALGSGSGDADDRARTADQRRRGADHRLAADRASGAGEVRPQRRSRAWPTAARPRPRSWCARSRKSGPSPTPATAGA
jgi:hypothetical protein